MSTKKFQNVLEKIRGIKSSFIIRNPLNENNLDEDFHYKLTPEN